MNALTYDLRSAAAARTAVTPVKPEKGLFARILDALIEARMRQAEREIRQHIRFVPESVLRNAGYKATYTEAGKLPFVK